MDLLFRNLVRGNIHMTSALRGREGVGKFLTEGKEVVWIWYLQGEGVQNPRNLADVICTCPLREPHPIRKTGEISDGC